MSPEKRAVWREILLLYGLTLIAIRLVVQIRDLGVPDVVLAGVPILFMYTPVWSCKLRNADPWDYPMALPAWGDRAAWLDAVKWAGVWIAIVAVPFVVGYHLWQTIGAPFVQRFVPWTVIPHLPVIRWAWPPGLLKIVFSNLFFVAIPEEMFYRGYVQTRFDEVYPQRWRLFGTPVGPGLVLTSILFAFGHDVVTFQWWHVFIFVPSLAFGWLRARTNGIVAGALFHAWCNITVTTLDTLYGMAPPNP